MTERDRTDTMAEIEETQEALRHSIEQSRKLSERTQQLLERHRREQNDRDRSRPD